MAHDKTKDLLGELEKLDRREDDILDVLVRRGARLEHDLAEAERRSRLVTGGDLQALTGALASLESAIDGVQTRIAKATDGNGAASAPTILELAARLREQDAAGDEIRRQLRERLRALGAVEDAAAAPKRASTFRFTDPRMHGADVKAFQRVLNDRLDAWGIHSHVDVDGEYGPQIHRVARKVAHGLGAAAVATELRSEGRPGDYLGALLVSGDEVVFHRFTATSAIALREPACARGSSSSG